jgi:hypothetical protein
VIKVIDEREKVSGIAVGIKSDGRRDCESLPKIWTGIPIGAGSDVEHAVTVEVANGYALRKKLAAKLITNEKRLTRLRWLRWIGARIAS